MRINNVCECLPAPISSLLTVCIAGVMWTLMIDMLMLNLDLGGYAAFRVATQYPFQKSLTFH